MGVTARPIFHEPHLPKQFVWRQVGYFPCWPWTAVTTQNFNKEFSHNLDRKQTVMSYRD